MQHFHWIFGVNLAHNLENRKILVTIFELKHKSMGSTISVQIFIALALVNVIDILQRKNLSHLGKQPELYLYGHPSLNLIDNRQILLSTIKYVKDTTRISTSVT